MTQCKSATTAVKVIVSENCTTEVRCGDGTRQLIRCLEFSGRVLTSTIKGARGPIRTESDMTLTYVVQKVHLSRG